MTKLEILLSISLVLTMVVSLVYIMVMSRKAKSNFDELIEIIGKKFNLTRGGVFDGVLSVDDFNHWYRYDNFSVSANAGTFLRVDKLSDNQIKEFINHKTDGFLDFMYFSQESISDFRERITSDWKERKKILHS